MSINRPRISFFTLSRSSLTTSACDLMDSAVPDEALVFSRVKISLCFSNSNSSLWVSHSIFILFSKYSLKWYLCSCREPLILPYFRLSTTLTTSWTSTSNWSFTSFNSILSSITWVLAMFRELFTSTTKEAFNPTKALSVAVA